MSKTFNQVKLNVNFTAISPSANMSNIESDDNISSMFAKIHHWYVKTNGFQGSSVTIPSITISNNGTTGNAITNISASNHALTLSKGSFIPLSGSSSISGSLIPSSTDKNLGSSSYPWHDCYFHYVNAGALYQESGDQGGSITSNASIIPYSTGILDLGSYSKYWKNAYVNNLTLANPLPVASGGTGCTSLADLKIALDIESFSDPTLVTETTLDTIEGTSVFMGVNQPFGEQYDWVGIQIGSSEVSRSGDVFQLVSVNMSDKQLLFRKNDLGEWSDWRRICFYDELPTIDSSLSSSSTNPVQNKVINTALGNKLDSSTVDSSGSSGSSGWYNCRINNGKIQYYNTDTTYTTTSSVISGSSALVTSGGVYSALSSKVNSSSLGDAAYKNYTSSVTSGSSNLITSGAVYTALAACMQNLGNIGAANLNNYTSESGFFKFSGASNAPNGTTAGGVGIVWHSGTFSGMFVICYDSSSKKEMCWARRYNGSTWTSWIQLGTL